MWYRKNLPGWERALRVIVGFASIGFALWQQDLVGWIVGASGVIAALTGTFGWCPMCAMAGRRLPGDGAA